MLSFISGKTGAQRAPGLFHHSPSAFRVWRRPADTDVSRKSYRRAHQRSDFLISTTPALPDTPVSTSEVVFPHFVTGSGYTTEFILMNSGPTSAGTLSLYSQFGADLPLIPPQ